MRAWVFVPVVFLVSPCPELPAEQILNVRDDISLRRALQAARPGTRIRIAPGRYRPGISVSNLRGTGRQPIVIEGSDMERPPSFDGGAAAWHLSGCEYITIRNLVMRGQTSNGMNVDDGRTYQTPAKHIVLEGIHVYDVGPSGNCDGLKLSGLEDFVVRNCSVEGCSGQALDMVGCHRGLIEGCRFVGREGSPQLAGTQVKGGSRDIVIRRCLFRNAGVRAVNLGGGTGLDYFRPPDAPYEAKDIVVEGCAFVGSEAPVAYVGVDGAVVRYNTFVWPGKWVIRILQETSGPRFVPCRNGRFEHNLVVFRRADVSQCVNIGRGTEPKTFVFDHNLWYCQDQPRQSRPELPGHQTNAVCGIDPKLIAPEQNSFKPQNPEAREFGAWAWTPDEHAPP